MARVPVVTREKVPAKHQKAFDDIIAGRGRGGAVDSGPGSVMINSPEMAKRANQLSAYLRSDSTLSKKVQELAMLTVARSMDCQYIWNAHAASGKKAGLSPDLVEALRENKPLPPLKREEEAVIRYGQEFFRTHRVSRGAFQTALEQLGAQGLTELTMLMGYYGMLAFCVNAFDGDLPSERTEPLLPV